MAKNSLAWFFYFKKTLYTTMSEKKYIVKGKEIEIDTCKNYYDFYILNEEKQLLTLDFEKVVNTINIRDKISVDCIIKELELLTRWITDAPRKRYYRNLRKDGGNVLSTEEFFSSVSDEKAEEMFTGFENSGKMAKLLLEIL